MQHEGLTIVDRKLFNNMYGSNQNRNISSDENSRKQGAVFPDQPDLIWAPEEIGDEERFIREASSGDDPCDHGPCNATTEDCIFNTDKEDVYMCLCKPTYENSSAGCIEIPESKKLYLTTKLNYTYTSALGNQSAVEFQDLQNSSQKAFSDEFYNMSGYKTLRVIQFRNDGGNTVFVYSIFFTVDVTQSTTTIPVAKQVLKMERHGEILMGNVAHTLLGHTGIFQTLAATGSGSDDMNWCASASLYSCGADRVCNDTGLRYTCICRPGTVNVSDECIGEEEYQYDLYPYGSTANDTKMAKGDDETLRVEITTGFAVADTLQYSAYIGINGLVTFGKRDSGLNLKLDKDSMMLCPYNADIITFGTHGEVWHRLYTQAEPDVAVFAKANREMTKFLQEDYKAKTVLVITWENVATTYTNNRDTETATFQTVLVYNGKTSYALVYYKTGAMNWEYRRSRKLVMGFSRGLGNKESAKESLYSNTREGFANFDRIKGNTGHRGMWIYALGEAYSADEACESWYQENLRVWSEIVSNSQSVTLCPCSELGLGQGWVFSRMTEDNNVCYRLNQGRSREFYPYGRECCYRRTGSFPISTVIQSPPYAGALTRYNSAFRELRTLHQEQDRDPHNLCCFQTTRPNEYCRLYYEVRPIGACRVSFAFFIALMFGDPHIQTLDGKGYTFNGWGEYTLVKLQTKAFNFTLQGRTDKGETQNGTRIDATIFTAFAAAENSAGIYVELEPQTNKTSMIIYASSDQYVDYSLQFQNDPSFLLEEKQFTLRRVNSSLTVDFALSGISLTISVGVKLLDIQVNMPLTHRNQTRGLFGDFNGNPNDDFILPNGTRLQGNLTERQIFQDFGSLWAISDSESVFRYPSRKGPADFRHANFTPIFLDEKTPAERHEAETWCGGQNNTACIFDYLATGNKVVASATKNSQQTAVKTEAALKNTVPELNARDTINVTAGQTVQFDLNGTDADSDKVVYYQTDDASGSFQLNNQTGRVSYTAPSGYQPDNLGFYVVDSNGAASPVIVVGVRYCTGCSGNGTCDPTQSRSTNNSQNFQIAVCICNAGYAGEDCEHDFNACTGNPCIPGQNCTDLSPDDEVALNRGYNCSACPTGFQVPVNGSKCEDIHECAQETDDCVMNCTNTEGSYECSCPDGYRLDADNRSCTDINECFERSAGCQQICTNFVGGFNCSCEEGYTLEPINKTCTQNATTQQTCANANCSQGCRLNATTNNTECFCNAGYTQNTSDNKLCDDVDECKQGICNQKCSNTAGSFRCSCYGGYQLEKDGTTCAPCPDLYYDEDCKKRCDCNGRSIECNHVTGCVCQAGWKGTNCTVDKDECVDNPGICGSALEQCANTNGSYRCSCLPGYQRNASGVCADVNECTIATTCKELETCRNTLGSYFCECKAGYQRDANNSCTDANECENGAATCQQKCINVVGSYNCECNPGFALDADRSRCKQAEEVCAQSGLNCGYACTLDDNDRPYCFCRTGFRLGTDKATCLDINECSTNNGGCSDNCTNSDGGFWCTCPVGKRLVDQKRCENCSAGTFGVNCQSECACGKGASRCDAVTGCVCSSGWTGSKCSYDIDECGTLAVQSECQTKNAVCRNLEGGYRCECRTGYEEKNNTCADIDECARSPCGQICENTVGSFRCSCNAGFTLNDTTNQCNDINECKLVGSFRCTQQCVNLVGSYRCACNQSGFILAADGYSCEARTKCAGNNTCPKTNGGCSVQNNTDTCFCNTGYTNKNNTCIFIVPNYCNGTSPCEQTCNQTSSPPYFTCSCNIGYQLNNDGRTCRECLEGKWGTHCTSDCSCNLQTTEYCNRTNGDCKCKSGWKDANCSTDIDECANETLYSCVDNSTCVNTNGSYICVCNDGFFKASDGNCTGCSEYKYGTNCEHTCQCVSLNTESCNKVNGSCTCKQGWQNATCGVDIDECVQQNTHNCSGDHVKCQNKDGGFDCVCDQGYRYNDTGACVDLNECLDDEANICPQLCNNTVGNYTCSCAPGYSGDGLNCTECVEGKWGSDCLSNCSCTDPTPECNKVNGSCGCKPGYTGVNCQSDIDECKEPVSPCGNFSNCINIIGRYECECWVGYYLASPQNCTECPHDRFGTNCSSTCVCDLTYSTCNNVNGTCHCDPGYKGPKCNQDINECTEVDPPPCGNNSVCRNVIGSFTCSCQNGYQDLVSDGKNCTACPHGTYGKNCSSNCICNTNHSTCNNVNGICDCFPGYQGDQCDKDVDECTVNPSPCGTNSNCTNTNGSYTCTCHQGYHDPVSSGRNCTDIDECASAGSHNCTNLHTCVNTDGSYTCSCHPGYTGNDTYCEDVDECKSSVCNEHNCTNTNGSYFCSCLPGYFGNGTVCEDIDECSTNSSGCQQNCNNTKGGYSCSCNEGYSLAADNKTCNTCPHGTYGKNCSSNCICNTNHSTCNNVNGICDCFPGYQGDQCDKDVDECTVNPSPCGTNSNCTNTNGSYTCTCHHGYHDPVSSGRNCTDIDECSTNSSGCQQNCNNTEGGYSCSCNEGHSLAANNKTCYRLTLIAFGLTIQITITNLSQILANNTSNEYKRLEKDVRDALFNEIQKTVRSLVDIIIKNFSQGSIKVEFEVVVSTDIDTKAVAQASKAIFVLLKTNLTIFNQTGIPSNATYNGKFVGNACDIFIGEGNCTSDQVCEVSDDLPTCRTVDTGESYFELIIGLSVGIPLFFVIVFSIAFCVYMKVKKGKNMESDDSDDEHEPNLSGLFSRRIATRAPFYDTARGMYTPDTLSSASSDEQRKGKGFGLFRRRPEYDVSPWGTKGSESSRMRDAGNLPSGFSWDVYYKSVPEEQFSMPRPRLAINPAYGAGGFEEGQRDSHT